MNNLVKMIVGLQFGDEGKGEEIHRLSQQADLVVRCAGGNNAGHTTVVDSQAIVLHLLPSSVTWGKKVGIGAGVVVDPLSLIYEVEYLRSFGFETISNLMVDPRATVVMPYHRVLDMAKEISRSRGGKAIGTTARGIGPAYSDLADRSAIRFGDLIGDIKLLVKLIEKVVAEKQALLSTFGLTPEQWRQIFSDLTQKEIQANQRLLDCGRVTKQDLDYARFALTDQIGFNVEEICRACIQAGSIIADWQCVVDVSELIHEIIIQGGKVLIEGAQGAFLDNIFGTYPFVTSSHTIAGGACIGLGIGPTLISEVRGVTKAYMTRVGNGPFPTKMPDELAAAIRGDGKVIGDEFGASTGRPRDCGWFDAVFVRTACRLNGATRVTLTKLDKLSGLEEILVGEFWEVREKQFPFMPAKSWVINDPDLRVNYRRFPGWQKDISKIRRWDNLPLEAKDYVQSLEAMINRGLTEKVVIDRIGVGPGFDDVIVR